MRLADRWQNVCNCKLILYPLLGCCLPATHMVKQANIEMMEIVRTSSPCMHPTQVTAADLAYLPLQQNGHDQQLVSNLCPLFSWVGSCHV